jgi:hypothetical protein
MEKDMKRLPRWLLLTGALAAQTVLADGDTYALSAEWESYVKPFIPIAERLAPSLHDPNDARERHELYEFLFSQAASGYVMLFYADPQHPDFWPLFNHAFDQGLPNPDTTYLTVPVDSTGTYRLSGYLGTSLIADIQQSGGEFMTRGTISSTGGGMGTAHANHKLRDFNPRADGYFEVVFSAARPKGYTGEWRALHAGTTFLFVRQVFYDWKNESASRLAISRLDPVEPKTRPDVQELQEKLKQLAVWTENFVKVSYSITALGLKQRQLNTFDFPAWSEAGFTTQKHVISTYELADDEALILETEVPTHCLYWAFQTGTRQWRSINPLYHQSSINGFQARLDNDGKFRAVISAQDPGVHNWLDTGGYASGEVTGRWNECSSAPLPKAIKVQLAQVLDYLPADTARVSSDERRKILMERREALQLRRRW